MVDQKRTGIATVFIAFGLLLGGFNNTATIITRTVFVLTGFVLLLPVFKLRYQSSKKDWQRFIILSTVGITFYLAATIMQLLGK